MDGFCPASCRWRRREAKASRERSWKRPLRRGDRDGNLGWRTWVTVTIQKMISIKAPLGLSIDIISYIINIYIYRYVCLLEDIFTGWWFGTFPIYPYFGNTHPNWPIFFRRVGTCWNHQPVYRFLNMAYPWRTRRDATKELGAIGPEAQQGETPNGAKRRQMAWYDCQLW